VAGTLLLMLLVYQPGLYTPDLIPKRLAFSLGSIVLCAVWLTRSSIVLRPSPLLLPAAGYVCISLMSILWAGNPFSGWVEGVQIATQFLVFVAIVQLLAPGDLVQIARAVSAGGLLLSILGIAQGHGIGLEWIPSVGPPSGTFVFRNLAAAALLGVLPLSFLLLLSDPTARWRIMGFLSTAAGLIFLFYTRTRGAWLGMLTGVGLAAGLLFFIPQARESVLKPFRLLLVSSSRRTLAACLLLFIGLVALPTESGDRVLQRFDQHKSSPLQAVFGVAAPGSDRGRLAMWRHTIRMFLDHPLGVGLDNWEFEYPRYDLGDKVTAVSEPVRPHNDVLWIAAEVGVLGLCCYVWLLLAAAAHVVRILRRGSDEHRRIALTFAVGIIALSVHGCFSFIRERPVPSAFFWTFLGGIGLLSKSRSAASQPAGKLLPAGALLVCLCALWLNFRHQRFDLHYASAEVNRISENWAEALEDIQSAQEWGLFDHRARFLEGRFQQRLGQNEEAAESYRIALRAHPNYANTHHNLGKLYTEAQEWALAASSLKRALQLRPSYDDARLDLSTVYLQTGRVSEAERQLLTILETAPADFPANADLSRKDRPRIGALANLGALRIQQARFTDAIVRLEAAVALSPRHAQALHNLGLAYEEAGRTSEAVRAYEQYLELRVTGKAYAEQLRSHIAQLRQKTVD
jgi:O-antigen ligase/tetratricopeptide (TPR) repeat protein